MGNPAALGGWCKAFGGSVEVEIIWSDSYLHTDEPVWVEQATVNHSHNMNCRIWHMSKIDVTFECNVVREYHCVCECEYVWMSKCVWHAHTHSLAEKSSTWQWQKTTTKSSLCSGRLSDEVKLSFFWKREMRKKWDFEASQKTLWITVNLVLEHPENANAGRRNILKWSEKRELSQSRINDSGNFWHQFRWHVSVSSTRYASLNVGPSMEMETAKEWMTKFIPNQYKMLNRAQNQCFPKANSVSGFKSVVWIKHCSSHVQT